MHGLVAERADGTKVSCSDAESECLAFLREANAEFMFRPGDTFSLLPRDFEDEDFNDGKALDHGRYVGGASFVAVISHMSRHRHGIIVHVDIQNVRGEFLLKRDPNQGVFPSNPNVRMPPWITYSGTMSTESFRYDIAGRVNSGDNTSMFTVNRISRVYNP